jgi:hypothetical protein
VQAAKLEEKAAKKKEHNNAVSNWRDQNKNATKDSLQEDFDKHFLGKEKKATSGASKKRIAKDKKYGQVSMPGKPARLLKKNDAKSANDMSSYRSPNKGGKGGWDPSRKPKFDSGEKKPMHQRGRSPAKKQNRPGKNAREAKRQRTH